MDADTLICLSLNENDSGYEIKLDNMRIHHVEEYSIKKSSAFVGAAELSLKMIVKYP